MRKRLKIAPISSRSIARANQAYILPILADLSHADLAALARALTHLKPAAQHLDLGLGWAKPGENQSVAQSHEQHGEFAGLAAWGDSWDRLVTRLGDQPDGPHALMVGLVRSAQNPARSWGEPEPRPQSEEWESDWEALFDRLHSLRISDGVFAPDDPAP